ncbi:MAG: carbohydrate kinase [Caldilineaceae bacterium]|nr:carbohydrate kinase [Caldilineaceae bacterium]
MNSQPISAPLTVDVLCAGFACHDLVFDVPHHPGADEKVRSTALLNCGGGLASNAAVTAARLGCRTAFAGYLGNDVYGDFHLTELQADGVDTDWVIRGSEPTPLSTILVKPDGLRTIVSYRGNSEGACAGQYGLSSLRAKSILIDGNQFAFAEELTAHTRAHNIPVVIDTDALRPQTAALVEQVDYVVASERFAEEYGGSAEAGLAQLATVAPNVVVTLGHRGLIWQRGTERGRVGAFPVNAIDTTGAGDAFHGAFAAGLAQGMEWEALLRYASAVGALCCTKVGGRVGIPTAAEVAAFLATHEH